MIESLRVLVVTPMNPYARIGGETLRIRQLIEALTEHGHAPAIAYFTGGLGTRDSRFDGMTYRYPSPARIKLRKILGPVLPGGLNGRFNGKHAKEWVASLAREYDVVIAVYATAALSCELVKKPVLVDLVDSLSFAMDQWRGRHVPLLRRLQRWTDRGRCRRIELKAMASATAFWISSERDRQFLVHNVTGLAQGGSIIPTALNPRPCGGGRRESNTILFLGRLDYFPNEGAAIELANDILPLVRSHVPNAKLVIAGANPSPRVLRLVREGVVVKGNVADPHALYESAQVFACPIRIASGIQTKILEAMGAGCPVVAYAEPLGGIPDAKAGVHALIPADKAEFAASLCRLLMDQREASSLASNARDLVTAQYSFERVASMLETKIRTITPAPK